MNTVKKHTLPPWTDRKRKGGRALIVEGGGMRGAFTGGVLAAMTAHHPARENFDLVVGVSSGSCAASYYVTESEQSTVRMFANLNMWRYELAGNKLISYFNPLKGKSFLNQEYLIDDLFGKKYRMHRERFDDQSTVPFYIVVTNIHTLKPEYIRATSQNILTLLKAATSLPIATKGKRRFLDSFYTDGAVLDPVPVQAVIDAGYTDITVVLTNPRHHRSRAIGKWLSRLSFPTNSRLAKLLNREHHIRYNRAYDIINHPPKGVKIHIIDPEVQPPAKLVTRSEKHLNTTVDMGLEAGMRYISMKVAQTERWFHRVFRIFKPRQA